MTGKSSDLHTHTIYSDGNNTPEEMIRSAISAGLDRIGISDHSYTSFDESYCIPFDRVSEYIGELRQLKDRCLRLKDDTRFAKAVGTDDIKLYVGIEQDYFSTYPSEDFDYVIGSVHYIRVPDNGHSIPEGCLRYNTFIYIPVDESPKILRAASDAYYGGDIYTLIEDYYFIEADVIRKTGADIIGHFSLIEKFNKDSTLFDPEDPRYIAAWQNAADTLLKSGAVFEINTGAMSRGYKSHPYPSREILKYIADHGGSVILSSDSHSKNTLMYAFSECYELAASLGLHVIEL